MNTTDADHLQTFEMLQSLGLFAKIITRRVGDEHYWKVKLHLISADDKPVYLENAGSSSADQARIDWVKGFRQNEVGCYD